MIELIVQVFAPLALDYLIQFGACGIQLEASYIFMDSQRILLGTTNVENSSVVQNINYTYLDNLCSNSVPSSTNGISIETTKPQANSTDNLYSVTALPFGDIILSKSENCNSLDLHMSIMSAVVTFIIGLILPSERMYKHVKELFQQEMSFQESESRFRVDVSTIPLGHSSQAQNLSSEI